MPREGPEYKKTFTVKQVLRKYKYPPDQAEEAVELVLQQVETLGASWM